MSQFSYNSFIDYIYILDMISHRALAKNFIYIKSIKESGS
jgi:hypothetical protein